ncbi:MAG: hypothetical protein CMH57_10510 [Myxococcales bacterium]|nr:hypothetical protein [Myxococcales bacterium]
MDVLHIHAVKDKGEVEATDGSAAQQSTEEPDAALSAREAETLRQLKAMRLRSQSHRFKHLRDSVGVDETLVQRLTTESGPSLSEIRALRESALSPDTSPEASARILDQALQLTIEVVMNMQNSSDVGLATAHEDQAEGWTPFEEGEDPFGSHSAEDTLEIRSRTEASS